MSKIPEAVMAKGELYVHFGSVRKHIKRFGYKLVSDYEKSGERMIQELAQEQDIDIRKTRKNIKDNAHDFKAMLDYMDEFLGLTQKKTEETIKNGATKSLSSKD